MNLLIKFILCLEGLVKTLKESVNEPTDMNSVVPRFPMSEKFMAICKKLAKLVSIKYTGGIQII